jgi:hypothetical protein
MQSLIRQSGTWRKAFRRAGCVAIPTGIVIFVLDSGSELDPPKWIIGTTYVLAVLAAVDVITRFVLTLLIIRGYRDDPNRKETAGYLTMLREVSRG